ncbi:AI-2E family transporter [Skermanella mucosa]|uniref:AI-2E family transporter n=1 Tax=Skermanella mucosa TaxID=1789672 RepID=UPI00192ADEB0|nr:AI-2E family transporter [Skermanella mucosa]UEM18930.1 AI-2E family transporter [Skermanella mucosa]
MPASTSGPRVFSPRSHSPQFQPPQSQPPQSQPSVRPLRVQPAAPAVSPGTTLGIIVTVVAALYFGRDILMPVALAILLSFALAPIVIRLRRWGLGRVLSVILVVLLMFTAILGFGTLVASQLVDLARNLPNYEQNIRAKIQSVRGATEGGGGGVIDQASEMLRDLSKELEQATTPSTEEVARQAGEDGRLEVLRPIPVEIHEPRPSPWNEIQTFLGPLVAPIGTAGIVLVFVIFMLLQREDLRDRLIRLVGANDLHRTTEAMDEAGARVSRYLLMQLIINVTYGIPVAVGLYFIGVPNPILWGVLATVLRFIPYVGPVVSAFFPIVLSFAVSPGWTDPLLTIGLFLGLELFSNNVLEPWLYGSSTGLSPLAVIAAAVVWITLWGPVGVLLATPLTVCLVVIGRHVPQLQFLHVMFGNDPVLPIEARFYQRLLARDPAEAAELVEEAAGERPLAVLYDELILPALHLAETDRQRGSFDNVTQAAIAEGIDTVVEALDDYEEPPASEDDAAENDAVRSQAAPVRVLCIAGRNELDRAAAVLTAHLLERDGFKAEALPCEAVSLRNLAKLDMSDVRLVCLSYLNPGSVQHARRVVRRLRGKLGTSTPIVVGMWSGPGTFPPADAESTISADRLETTLSGTLAHIRNQQIFGSTES